MNATVYVVVMDDNASDTPLASVELVTFDADEAEAKRQSLIALFDLDNDGTLTVGDEAAYDQVTITVTPMGLTA